MEKDTGQPSTLEAVEPFAVEVSEGNAFRGEILPSWRPVDDGELARALGELIDPAGSETVHWGRNYLYRTLFPSPAVTGGGEAVEVVVKQFRNESRRQRAERRWKGSKAERSWRAAWAFLEAGVATPQPVLLAESERPDGPSYFVCRHLADTVEARYFFRALNEGTAAEGFPSIDPQRLLAALGRTLRRMHDAGIRHRDMSSGNVLIEERDNKNPSGEDPTLWIIDLNRARVGKPPGKAQRSRDLCRLMIFRPQDQETFLTGYWGREPSAAERRLYLTYQRAFLAKNRTKNAVRQRTRGIVQWLRDLVLPRSAHAHIPAADPAAETREKVVWDHLSDQPHQHAGKLEKLGARLGDFPQHAAEARTAATVLPAARKRYRELVRELYHQPVEWPGAGVCLRPWPAAPEALLAAVRDLAVRRVLLRLHPWQEDHSEELALARALAEEGYDLTFSLPQNRELVRDPERWRNAIERIAEQFGPYGRSFQIGQAINRSKWGVWNLREFYRLAEIAAAILRRRPGVEVVGPGVIDFEIHATAAALNWRHTDLAFDALASLLYVDRRGAPENRQIGFDTAGKVTFLKALAETARNCRGRSWVTEVNWPLWEGPHSPAGRGVSVDEETQANFLSRYFLLAFGTGWVERIYWWQLIARGYGLVSPESGRLRRRPSFEALAFLERHLRGGRLLGPLPAADPACLLRYESGSGTSGIIAWSKDGESEVALPAAVVSAMDRGGKPLQLGRGKISLGPSPVFLAVEE